ncbi:hypothetical protein EDC04DRAFT_2875105 [Pisolithus marmoratus]|nr:hypothetical protein EDC04DRAFT_2875105 [Pisolithus marmoratus]
MLAKKINTLLDFWAALLLLLGGTPLFANRKDLYCMIDHTSVGTVQWENFKIQHKHDVQHAPDEQNEQDEQGKLIELEDGQDGLDRLEAPWMFDTYDVWYRDPCQVVHNLLVCADIKDEMDFMPYQEFNGANEQRCWENFMSGDWAWNDAIIHGDPFMVGATLVPIILGSDKTTVSVVTGFLMGNVHNTTHCAHHDAVVLIAFLAMPKSTREHASTQSRIADYKEQALLSCIMHNWCPECLAHQEDLDQELAMKELDLQLLWVVYGIDGDVTPFTSMFPCVDIHKMLLLDILHQLIKGGFKDHLVDWVERYLIQTHGKSAAEKVLDEIDKSCQHFKQWTSNNSKGLMKVYIAAIEGFVPMDVIHTFHMFLKFCYFVFGCTNGLCSSITKSKHIKAIKRPYQHTNHFQALGQMLLINQRLDKLAAPCVDFQDHGMLMGTCLNMHDLVIELNTPWLIDTLCHFLQLQLYHDDDHDLEDVPLDKCPLYDGPVHVYNSACSMFYAPSDMSGIHGMHHEYICSCPEWRNMGPCYDCVYVVTDPHVEGMLGLDVTHVLCFFSFNYLGTDYPCAIIHWFDHVGDVLDADTGMWIFHVHNPENIAIIHIDTIYCTAQLIPIYVAHHIDPGSVKPHESYDKYQTFYVNKFADHHAFKIAS